MCGIAGFLGPFGPERLRAMTDAMRHRGPDDSGHEVLETRVGGLRAGLGHRRLSIIDLAGGHQPMWTADRSLAIVFNGEIYNYRQLRRELEGLGGRFATTSDTEAIIEGWRLLGEKILPRLEGMFAFGLWDTRTQEWILARDRAGIKPLYYTAPRVGQFAFASEIKPLLPFLDRVEPHLPALYEHLIYGWAAGAHTLFRGVQTLAPGHILRIRAGADAAAAPERFAGRRPDLAARSAAHWAEAVRDTLDRAVGDQLVADVPVGINLSGGLDSSAVVASMIRHAPAGRIQSFTIGFGRQDDETPFARRMAAHAGVQHLVREAPADAIQRDFAKVVTALEEPIAHPVLQTTYEVARLAREHVKVVLIGEGSDELFLGYPQYRTLTPPFSLLPAALRRDMYLAVGCVLPTARQLEKLLAPGMRDPELLRATGRMFDPYFLEQDFAFGAQAFELDHPLVRNQLMRVDKLTMAHSLEARVPFLDERFVDLALSVPVAARVTGSRTKIALREAMAGRLPPEIIDRPKTGKKGTQALLPYLAQLIRSGPLSDLVSPQTLRRRGWFDPAAVLGYLDAATAPTVRWHPVESRRRQKFTLALAMLEQWARIFLDGSSHSRPDAS